MNNQKIGKYICQLRQDKNLTQKDLADKIGVTDKAISKWECGNGLPDITLLEPLATALDTSVAELLSGEAVEDANIEQTDKAIVQALEHYKWAQRRTMGILLLIFGAIMLLVFAFSIVGQWYVHALVLGIVTIAIGIVLIAAKNSLACCKVPKAAAQWIAFGALIVAIVLEALPYGVVLNFASPPNEEPFPPQYYSYFDFTPFGYANFAPLITALLTVALAILSLVSIFVKRTTNNALKSQFIVTIVAAVISLCPIFFEYEYVTVIGVFVTLLLSTSAIFCAIANAKENVIAANNTAE